MIEFFKICGAVIVCSAMLLVLAGRERELLSLITAFLFLSVFLFALTRFQELTTLGKDYLQQTMPIQPEPVLKICGIAFGGAAACTVCDIVGQKNVGGVLEFLTIIEIFFLALPLFKDIFQEVILRFSD